MYAPACEQKELAAEMLVDMQLRLACYYEEKGQADRAARQLPIPLLRAILYRQRSGSSLNRWFNLGGKGGVCLQDKNF